MGTYRKSGVEQQYTLLSPTGQVARGRNRLAQVVLYLLEDVLQRRRKRHSVGNGEAQSLRLTRFVVRVLTYYHHLHLVERTQIEGVEDEATRRIAGLGGVFLAHEVGELGEVRLLKLLLQVLVP